MIFEFRNLHYLDQKFDTLYPKYQNIKGSLILR